MSHTVKIKTAFKELEILKKSLTALGWTVKEKATIRTFSSVDSKKVYDFVAVNPSKVYNAYDLGITVAKDELEIFGDFYGGSIAATLGNELSALKQQYAMQIIDDEFLYQGASVNKVKQANGSWLVEIDM